MTSREKGIKKLLQIFKENSDENFLEIGIMQASAQKEAEDFEKRILFLLPQVQTFISEFSPIMGYAP